MTALITHMWRTVAKDENYVDLDVNGRCERSPLIDMRLYTTVSSITKDPSSLCHGICFMFGVETEFERTLMF
jgi:hypothetical protein